MAQLAVTAPEARFSGFDLSASSVAHAKQALAKSGVVAEVAVENAEALPLRDGLVAAATCVFLFHELPKQARRQVASELKRILVP